MFGGILALSFKFAITHLVRKVTFLLLIPFQVMFEEYKFAGVYIAIQAVLTLYAQGNVLNNWQLLGQ